MMYYMMTRFFYERLENIVGKEENAGYKHFLLFLQCFFFFFFKSLLLEGFKMLKLYDKGLN